MLFAEPTLSLSQVMSTRSMPSFFALLECKPDHRGGNSFSPLRGAYAVADMPAAKEETVVEIMANIHRAHEDIPLLVKAKEGRIGHKPLGRLGHVELRKISRKIAVIVLADRLGNDLITARRPFVHHFGELRLVCGT